MIERIAPTSLPVLIDGATGSGKELVAQAIHHLSGRGGPLVSVNICAVGESMFESVLFGHQRGAFTGAIGDVEGLIAEANRGTLFLDEIGSLPLREQAKLLRVIETKTYRAIGASRDRESDFRLVSSTNEDLHRAVDTGRFRADLLYRLGRIGIRVPSLAERRGDIPLLVRRFAEATSPFPAEFETAAMSELIAYDWPGNVRELQNVVSTVLSLANSAVIGRREVLEVLDCGRVNAGKYNTPPFSAARQALIDVLEASGWDTQRAADHLRVHRVTIYRRMRRLGINAPRQAAGWTVNELPHRAT